MPIPLNQHKSAVVTGKRFGREILMILGKEAKEDNKKTIIYNLKDQTWRTGSELPSVVSGTTIKYDEVRLHC